MKNVLMTIPFLAIFGVASWSIFSEEPKIPSAHKIQLVEVAEGTDERIGFWSDSVSKSRFQRQVKAAVVKPPKTSVASEKPKAVKVLPPPAPLRLMGRMIGIVQAKEREHVVYADRKGATFILLVGDALPNDDRAVHLKRIERDAAIFSDGTRQLTQPLTKTQKINSSR